MTNRAIVLLQKARAHISKPNARGGLNEAERREYAELSEALDDDEIDGVPADAYEANNLECAIEQVRSLMRAGVNRETAESRVARDFCLDQWLIGINIDRQDAELVDLNI